MFSEEVELFLEDYKENLNKAATHLQNEYVKIRAGRANPKIIENVKVDYYGTPTPIYQMASISVPDARQLLISPWDISVLKNVSRAIEEANLGLNPSDDGRSLRLSFPPLTEERRRELVKEISKLLENAKISSRNERRVVLEEFKRMKKDSEITEDDLERLEKEVQKVLDASVANLEQIFANKQKELMEV